MTSHEPLLTLDARKSACYSKPALAQVCQFFLLLELDLGSARSHLPPKLGSVSAKPDNEALRYCQKRSHFLSSR
ncbi:MAG TPA: hypothetical protein V6D29_23300 [Leptolyngbyaceae cyanobacterium]